MCIYESSKDYGTGSVLMLWDGDRPSNEEFIEYALENYGVTGSLKIEDPETFKGYQSAGTATVTPNAKLNGA
jgi:hypothetical protein